MSADRVGGPDQWSLEEVQDAVVAGRLTPDDVLVGYRWCREEWEPLVGAFVGWDDLRSTADAERTAERLRGAEPAPLDGIGIAVKDNIQVAGQPMTAGSSWWRVMSTESADCWQALETAGAMYLGKTNLHEFAFGASTVNRNGLTTRNPWDTERIAGGSSGGSAVAVAIGACGAALGTDTGGSIRIPAALTGVTGFKPTFGRVPVAGVFPLSPSGDHVGVLSRTAAGCARVFAALPGQHRSDAVTWPDRTFDGVRIGLLTSHLDRSDPAVAARILRALTVLDDLGATVEEAAVPDEEEARAATLTMVRFEAAQLHRKWLDDPRAQYCEDVRARLEEGLSISGTEYRRARQRREQLVAAILAAQRGFDAVAGPTTPITAPTVAACQGADAATLQSTLLTTTYWCNVTGQPAISVPSGRTPDGLPVGLQLAADLCDDHNLLGLAVALQRVTDWHTARPVHERSPA